MPVHGWWRQNHWGILGPTLRGSESGDLGQDSGILFVKSSLRDSKVQPGPGATVYEILFAKSRHSNSCSSSTLSLLPSFLWGMSMFITCSDKERKGGRRETEKQTTLILLIGKWPNSLYSVHTMENQLLNTMSWAPGWLSPQSMQLLISGSWVRVPRWV